MNLIYVQNVRLKRKVFNLRLKISTEIVFFMSSGKLFQRLGAATEKARRP